MLIRRLTLNLVAISTLVFAAMLVPGGPGAVRPAHAQTSIEFRDALGPYGTWRHHPRFGDVWVPRTVARGWRPYENGHWVYTDEWGWYWISDDQEADWGWVAFHYGRWVNDRRWGWIWVPGDEWAPAWVDWRYGDDYIGWAPLPPDNLIDTYEDQPSYWVFVQPRYFVAPQPRRYFLAARRNAAVFRGTHVVNRTLPVQGARLAVNPGIPAGYVAHVTRAPLPSYRVEPHVLAGTQGVAGAVTAHPGAHVRGPASVQRTTAAINPSASAAAPTPLTKGQRGQLGSHPPRAAQGGAPPAPGAPPPNKPPGASPVPVTPPAGSAPPRPNGPPANTQQNTRPAPPAGAPAPPPPAATTPPPPAPAAKPPATPAPRPSVAPAPARPATPPPPAVTAPAHPAPPAVAHPSPPPVAHPVPPAHTPPPAAHAPPPAAAHPPAPPVAHGPPPAAHKPPPPAAKGPPPKPGEKPKPEEQPK